MDLKFSAKAIKDLKVLPKPEARNILNRFEELKESLEINGRYTAGVKHLTNFTPEYRLRVGTYRALFEVIDDSILVQRILHRSKAYK